MARMMMPGVPSGPGQASDALGFTRPDAELQRELADRRKKALDAARLSQGGISQLLMGAGPPSQNG